MTTKFKLISDLKKIIKDAEEHELYLRSAKMYQHIEENRKFINEYKKLLNEVENN